MSTDVITNLTGSLDAELEKARATLREVDDGIKKLFGKENTADGGSFGNRSRSSRGSQDYGDEHFGERGRRRRTEDYDDTEPLDKRLRLDGNSIGKGSPMVIGPRIRPRISTEEEDYKSGGARRLQSRIVTSGKEKSREEVLAEQREDKKGRDRNKRMFGALLGTLQRFKQEETKLKEKEDKRAQIEAKLDEAAKKERDEVRTKRQQLIRERKLRITEIKRLEIKRNRLADLTAWESKTKYLSNFIRTEAKPHIFYVPKKLNPIMECRLEQSKQHVAELIANKRKLVLEDLEDFEQRSKRYWERRLDGRETRKADPMDEDIEAELKEIMKNDELTAEEEMPGETDREAVDFKVTVFTNTNDSINSNNDSTNANHRLLEYENAKDSSLRHRRRSVENENGEIVTSVVELKREETEYQLDKIDADGDVEEPRTNLEDETESRSAHSEVEENQSADESDDDDN